MVRYHGIVLKSRHELSIMREAGRINALALLAAVEVVRPGVKTQEIDAAAAEVLKKQGAKPAFLGYPGPYPYPAMTTISVNDELVHGIPGERRLHEGDIVSIDCGSIVEGFVADSALTVGVGELSEEAKRLLDVTLQSLFTGIRQMRLGNCSGDVSSAIQQYVESHGFNVVREYTGHGIGRNMHEDPQVPNYGTAGKGLELKKGMTIALEPMVLAGGFETRILEDQWCVASRDGRLTAHFEHTVAVTRDGPLILTALDGDLDEGKTLHYNGYFVGRPEPVLK
ncbi:MAG: type I methionyl aminopeptidase [Chloroflexi bacterium RBG_16_48_8]|nr:MAG: type I methionyl aminopeptidase [Chloroflexi bacterium RBG_16_48_8]